MDHQATDLKLYDTLEKRMDTMANSIGEGRTDTKAVARVFGAVKSECSGGLVEGKTPIEHMLEMYGIRIWWVDGTDHSGWAMDFEVVDEVKYTMFLLKYSK